jgi:hypothetical protein
MLGYVKNNDAPIHKLLNKMDDGAITPPRDRRSKAGHKNKVDRLVLQEHIESFRPTVSHYHREHAPNVRYLPSDISVQAMYNDFKEKNKSVTCSYDLHRTVVKELNISFSKLGHEQCEQCGYFAQHDRAHNAEI